MARLRYLKSSVAAPASTVPTRHNVRSIRAVYETDPEIARALLPRPLVAAEAPEIFVQFAHVAMHLSPERTVEIGAATVGVACTLDGERGHYVLAMPMEGEFVVIGGREKFGEPKKIAQTRFSLEDGALSAAVIRHGIPFLEMRGRVGPDSAGPRTFTERFYCFKALPACQPAESPNGGFDGAVLLTRLTWDRDYTSLRTVVDGEIILRESPFDPLVDVPVRRLLRMEFAEGATRTRGEVVREVPGEWLAPFLPQRYDDPQVGVEIPLTRDAGAHA